MRVIPAGDDKAHFVIRFADRELAILVEVKRHLNVAAARQLTHTTVGHDLR